MMPLIAELGPWKWIIAGAILLALELAVPGAFMMWLGLAAVLVGVLSFVLAWSWQWPGGAVARFAVASVPPWRRCGRNGEPRGGPRSPTRRTGAWVGQPFTLDNPLGGGVGTIRVGDTIWGVSGADRPAGTRVKFSRVDGATLVVEPVI